jgi:hypothetical protein
MPFKALPTSDKRQIKPLRVHFAGEVERRCAAYHGMPTVRPSHAVDYC